MVSLSGDEPKDKPALGGFEDMISNRWLEKRKPYWARLEELVQRSSRGVAALSHGELQELGLLYRQTASDLATVREDATTRQLASYLNQLLGRCHNLIYLGDRKSTRLNSSHQIISYAVFCLKKKKKQKKVQQRCHDKTQSVHVLRVGRMYRIR